jgi:hypothetical protein
VNDARVGLTIVPGVSASGSQNGVDLAIRRILLGVGHIVDELESGEKLVERGIDGRREACSSQASRHGRCGPPPQRRLAPQSADEERTKTLPAARFSFPAVALGLLTNQSPEVVPEGIASFEDLAEPGVRLEQQRHHVGRCSAVPRAVERAVAQHPPCEKMRLDSLERATLCHRQTNAAPLLGPSRKQ